MKASDSFNTDAFLVFVRDTVPHDWDAQIIKHVERVARQRRER